MKYIYLISLTSLIYLSSWSQSSLIQDSKGETSINILSVNNSAGVVGLNTAAQNISLNYIRKTAQGPSFISRLFWGLNANAKANTQFARIIKGTTLSPEASVAANINYGYAWSSNYFILGISAKYTGASYTLYDPLKEMGNQIYTTDFNGYNFAAYSNYQGYLLSGTFIYGIKGSYRLANNINSLEQLDIEDSKTINDSVTKTVRVVKSENQTAFSGTYKTYNALIIINDLSYIPDYLNNRVILSLFERSNNSNSNWSHDGGFGIYINQSGSPNKVVGGIIYEVPDIFNQLNDKPIKKKAFIALVAGYNF